MTRSILLVLAILTMAGCAGGTAVASPVTPPPDPAWTPPRDFEITPLDRSIAYRWDTSPECTLDKCWGIHLVTRDGCSTLYVELTIIDRKGAVIGSTNDSLNDVRAGEQATMTFDTGEDAADTARLAALSCRRAA